MDEFDRNWKENFDLEAAASDAFLLPDEHIMTAVEKELFPEKKKRYALLYWFMSGLGIIALFFIFNSLRSDEPSNKLATNQTELSKQEQEIQAKDIATQGRELDDTKAQIPAKSQQRANGNDNAKEIVTTSNDSDIATSKGQTISSTKASRIDEKPDGTRKRSVFTAQNDKIKMGGLTLDNLSNSSSANNTSQSKNGIVNNAASVLTTTDQQRITGLQIEKVVELPKLSALSSLALRPVQNFAYENGRLELNSVIPIVERENKNKMMFVAEANGLYVHWRDMLNDEYAAALEGADFFSEDRSGFGWQGALSMELNRRWSLKVGSSIVKISSVSGHNSMLNYSLQEETTDLQNIKSVGLATPYGSLESEVTFRRSPTITDDHEIDLAVNTTHSIQTVSLFTEVGYDLINKSKWSIGLSLGPEIVWLNSIMNDVSFTVNNTDQITIENQRLTQEQAFLKSKVFFLRAGIEARLQLTNRFSLGSQFNYASALTPTFAQSNFESYARKFSIGLGLGYNF